MSRRYALVPAAGGGTRSGRAVPKQYHPILGRPVLAHTLDRLTEALALDGVFVAIAPDDDRYAGAIGTRPGVETLRCGGPTRAATVGYALAALASRCRADDWVLVHDAARPCVPVATLRGLVAALEHDPVGGLTAVPVADTLKRGDGGDAARVVRTEARDALWQAQTPQMFRCGLLREALSRSRAVTDEAGAVEALGQRPLLVAADPSNLKVTYPSDLALAERLLLDRKET